jgi:lysyl-tRNA synthetase class 2
MRGWLRSLTAHRSAAFALGAWGLVCCAIVIAPLSGATAHELVHGLRHSVARALHSPGGATRVSEGWGLAIDGLIACAVAISLLAMRSLLRPPPGANSHHERDDRAARELVERYGEDSLAPFLVRADKALAFAAGGVLSYCVIGGTAIVSSDPVGPDGTAGDVVREFLEFARSRRWRVVLWATSGRHLDAYRRLGLRAICVGEEAFVDPRRFTLEGRAVRKLRQSVHRVHRRGWTISVHAGRDVSPELEAELDCLEQRWRARQPHLHGFAMGFGEYEPEIRGGDLYVVGRTPDRRLGAVVRFASHRGNLSLDTMRRDGETPNGLNEALVAHALEYAREHGVTQVSLNYAGLAHLVRSQPDRSRIASALTRRAARLLHRRFQLDRLVRFNEKFSPAWRPRYLVYESRRALPRAILRALQAEGYLAEGRWLGRRRRAPLPTLARRPGTRSAS